MGTSRAPTFDEAKLLTVIQDLVNRQQPMMGEVALARWFAVSKAAIRTALTRLRKAGAIRIERAARSHRVLLQDGRATGWTAQGGPGPRAAGKAPVRAEVPVLRLLEGGAVSEAWTERFAALPPSSRRCSWPTWPHEAEVPPMPPTFCDAPAVTEHPYCAVHCARAYSARREAA